VVSKQSSIKTTIICQFDGSRTPRVPPAARSHSAFRFLGPCSSTSSAFGTFDVNTILPPFHMFGGLIPSRFKIRMASTRSCPDEFNICFWSECADISPQDPYCLSFSIGPNSMQSSGSRVTCWGVFHACIILTGAEFNSAGSKLKFAFFVSYSVGSLLICYDPLLTCAPQDSHIHCRSGALTVVQVRSIHRLYPSHFARPAWATYFFTFGIASEPVNWYGAALIFPRNFLTVRHKLLKLAGLHLSCAEFSVRPHMHHATAVLIRFLGGPK
jgi:hypothetical protein